MLRSSMVVEVMTIFKVAKVTKILEVVLVQTNFVVMAEMISYAVAQTMIY